MITSLFICMSAVHIILICFIPFTGTINSINWSAPDVWVFMAQLVEPCSANAEATGSNPVKAPKTFFCLNRNHNCDDHIFIHSKWQNSNNIGLKEGTSVRLLYVIAVECSSNRLLSSFSSNFQGMTIPACSCQTILYAVSFGSQLE